MTKEPNDAQSANGKNNHREKSPENRPMVHDKKTITSSRRRALKLIGSVGICSTVGFTGTSMASGPSDSISRNSYSDWYTVNGGDHEGILETSIETRAANDAFGYWQVPMRITSNQTTWYNPPSGDSYLTADIGHVDLDIHWDNSESSYSQEAITADNGPEFIGSWAASQTKVDQDYSKFDAVLEWGWEMGLDTIDTYVDATTLSLYDKYTLTQEIWNKYESHNELNTSITRDWDFAQDFQCTTFANYFVRLYEGESIFVDIGNHVNTSVSSLYNGLTYLVIAPDTSPNSSSSNIRNSTKTTSNKSSDSIQTIKAKQMIDNPTKYGVTKDSVRNLDPQKDVNLAPVRVEVSDVTHEAPDEYINKNG